MRLLVLEMHLQVLRKIFLAWLNLFRRLLFNNLDLMMMCGPHPLGYVNTISPLMSCNYTLDGDEKELKKSFIGTSLQSRHALTVER